MEKQKFWVQMHSFDYLWLQGPIDTVIKKLNEFKILKQEEGYSDIELKEELYFQSSEIVAFGYRLETDSEYKDRITKEQQKRDQRKNKEEKKLLKQKEQYLKLKEIFEPKTPK